MSCLEVIKSNLVKNIVVGKEGHKLKFGANEVEYLKDLGDEYLNVLKNREDYDKIKDYQFYTVGYGIVYLLELSNHGETKDIIIVHYIDNSDLDEVNVEEDILNIWKKMSGSDKLEELVINSKVSISKSSKTKVVSNRYLKEFIDSEDKTLVLLINDIGISEVERTDVNNKYDEYRVLVDYAL